MVKPFKVWNIDFDKKKLYALVSTRKNKKYDVFDEDWKYLFSFGDKRYQHYKDKLGHYEDLNHNDEQRRNDYLKRSKPLSPIGLNANTFSRYFLW